jgi:hypothetical protein
MALVIAFVIGSVVGAVAGFFVASLAAAAMREAEMTEINSGRADE